MDARELPAVKRHWSIKLTVGEGLAQCSLAGWTITSPAV